MAGQHVRRLASSRCGLRRRNAAEQRHPGLPMPLQKPSYIVHHHIGMPGSPGTPSKQAGRPRQAARQAGQGGCSLDHVVIQVVGAREALLQGMQVYALVAVVYAIDQAMQEVHVLCGQ